MPIRWGWPAGQPKGGAAAPPCSCANVVLICHHNSYSGHLWSSLVIVTGARLCSARAVPAAQLVSTRSPMLNFCVGGVRPSWPQQRAPAGAVSKSRRRRNHETQTQKHIWRLNSCSQNGLCTDRKTTGKRPVFPPLPHRLAPVGCCCGDALAVAGSGRAEAAASPCPEVAPARPLAVPNRVVRKEGAGIYALLARFCGNSNAFTNRSFGTFQLRGCQARPANKVWICSNISHLKPARERMPVSASNSPGTSYSKMTAPIFSRRAGVAP